MNLIILLGQTCCGKTAKSIEIAKKNNGFVVSCDSRQVYKNLNIGTAKVEGIWKNQYSPFWLSQKENLEMLKHYEAEQIPHFLIDFVDPKIRYNLADYVLDWIKINKQIRNLKNPPGNLILTGGTGLWAKAIYEKIDIGIIKKNFEKEAKEFKKKLELLELLELQNEFQTEAGYKLNQSDFKNSRRLQSHLFRIKAKKENWVEKIIYPEFAKTEYLAIKADQEILKQKIKQRIDSRVEDGLEEEVKNISKILSKERINELGLEYKLTLEFLESGGKIGKNEWIKKLKTANIQYAKRQLTWLKKQPLKWI